MDPKEAMAIKMIKERKKKKMAQGGLLQDDSEEESEIESSTGDGPFRGVLQLQEDSHSENVRPYEYDPMIAALKGADHSKNGGPDSDIDEEETVALPESHFAAQAERLIQARKKRKAIQP